MDAFGTAFWKSCAVSVAATELFVAAETNSCCTCDAEELELVWITTSSEMPRAHATGPGGGGGNGAAVVFTADELVLFVLFVLFVPLPGGGDGGDSCIRRRRPGGAPQSLYVRVTVMAASGMP